MSDNHYVYTYTDPRNNEIFYVGMGKDYRYNAHLCRKDHHPMTYKIRKIRAAGLQPIITKIIENIDREFAALVEQEAIQKYGRNDLGLGPLLNLTDGGDGSYKRDPVKLKAMGEKVSASKKGMILTPEHIQALKDAKRPPITEEARKTLSAAVKRSWDKRKGLV